MHLILAWTIVIIGGTFMGLTLLIVGNKAWRESVESHDRRRRQALEPGLLEWAHGQQAALLPALGGRLDPGDRRVVEDMLIDHLQRVRGIENERLSRAFNELGLVDEHLHGLRSRRWWCRARSAERLGLSGAQRAVDALAQALQDEAPEVRLRAAKSLGALGGTASVRVLIRTLDQPNRWSIIRIADILTAMGREVVDELIEAFPRLGLNGQLAALDILGRIRPLRTAPWIARQMDSPNADVRARACHALGCIGDPHSSLVLRRALTDAEWPVRAMAAKALGQVRVKESVEDLCAALADREWWVRSNAARALCAVGASGIEALERMLGHDDRFARHQAVLMLQEAGIVDRRVAALGYPEGPERAAAEQFVQRLIAAGQPARLNRLRDTHQDPRVRQALAALIPQEPHDAENS